MLKILIALFLVFALWIIKNIIKSKIDQNKIKTELKDIFSKIDITSPSISFFGSYGFPAFKITFKNEKEHRLASQNQLFNEFEKYLDTFYKNDFGGNFNAGLAVDYTYPGKVYSFNGS